jgi:hypothetical protein
MLSRSAGPVIFEGLGLQRARMGLGQQPRSEGGDVDDVADQVEGVAAEHGGAAVVAVLVVGQVDVHVVAGAVVQHRAGRWPGVAAEGQEDLVVAADEPVPQPLAVGGQGGGAVIVGGGGEVVGSEHARQAGVVSSTRWAQASPVSEARQSMARSSHCRPPASNTWYWW